MLQVADYPDHSCDCPKCVDMCERVPCRPLPSEIAGMPDDVQARLVEIYLEGGVYCLQARSIQRNARRFGQCTFLTEEDKCELHGTCKPFEGRKVICSTEDYPDGHHTLVDEEGLSNSRMSEIIYEEWATDEGQQVLKDWQIKFPPFSVS